MRNRRLRTGALMSAAAASVLMLGLAPHAQASSDDAGQSEASRAKAACPVDNVCFFPESDFRGTPVNVNPANMPVCGATPNIAKSIVNLKFPR